jgi:hypothetical protein
MKIGLRGRAIAHKVLVAIHHMLSQQLSYNDLARNLVHRLQRLG